jgi:hypothetical protein
MAPDVKTVGIGLETYVIRKHIEVCWAGIIIGSVVIFSGIALLLLGISGSFDINIEFAGISTQIINATPGVLISLIGICVVIRFKSKIRVEREITKTPEGDIIEKVEIHVSSPLHP